RPAIDEPKGKAAKPFTVRHDLGEPLLAVLEPAVERRHGAIKPGRIIVEPDAEHLGVDRSESGDAKSRARAVKLGAGTGQHPILRGKRRRDELRRLGRVAAERSGDAAKRWLIRCHRLEPRHDRVEHAIPWALLRR